MMWTLDQACNWSDLSNGATCMFLWAPGPVTNLNAFQGQYGRSIQLVWTAPGDNGYSGTLLAGSEYAIQRSSWSGVTYSTYSVDTVYLSTASVTPGSYQSCNLTSLQQGVTYYIALWTANEMLSWSSISNSTNTWATMVNLSITLPTTWFYYGTLATNISTDTYNPAVVTNSGNVYETYNIQGSSTTDFLLAASPAMNTFELQAAFNGPRPASLASYNTNGNQLSLSSILCTGSMFTIDGSKTGANVDPFPAISTDTQRNLWFNLSTPLATGTTAQESITVTITAQQTNP